MVTITQVGTRTNLPPSNLERKPPLQQFLLLRRGGWHSTPSSPWRTGYPGRWGVLSSRPRLASWPLKHLLLPATPSSGSPTGNPPSYPWPTPGSATGNGEVHRTSSLPVVGPTEIHWRAFNQTFLQQGLCHPRVLGGWASLAGCSPPPRDPNNQTQQAPNNHPGHVKAVKNATPVALMWSLELVKAV